MKSRSEAKAAKAAAKAKAPEKEPEDDGEREAIVAEGTDADADENPVKGPPKNPFQWPNANKGKGETELREDLRRVVETVWVDDIHGEWLDLEKALSLGTKRSEHAYVIQALDKVAGRADRAHRLYLTAKLARDKWEAENEPIWSAMWSEATQSLQSEKDSGTRSKQITDADVKARVATLHPDQYRAQEDRRRAIELTVRSLERLSDIWFKKISNLEAHVSKLRG